jgi:hypothetical protein
VLDHPAGGICFGRQGGFVALFCQKCGLQLSQGQSALLGVISFQLLGQLADSGGELLGLAAQLPQGTGSLQRAGGACHWRSR